jgi:murein DD-endopeptidase MepM/ murein hydrolase activator NlpD
MAGAGACRLAGGWTALCLGGAVAMLGSLVDAGAARAAEPVAAIVAGEPRAAAAGGGVLDLEIVRLRDAFAALTAPSAADIDRAERVRDSMAAASQAAAAAAAAAEVEQRELGRLLATAIARAVRDVRARGASTLEAGRARSAVAALGSATRQRAAAVDWRALSALRLRTMARRAALSVDSQRRAQAVAAERRLDLAMRLAELEAARTLADIPELPLVARLAVTSPPQASQPDAAATADRAGPSGDASDAAIAPAAGPPDDAAPPTPADDGWQYAAPIDGLALLAPAPDRRTLSMQPLPPVPDGFPIAGQVSKGFEERGIGLRGRGVTFASGLAQPVRAPRGGTVAFAGPFKSFGLLLIVEHGHGYHSLLAGMARLDVRAGDVVVAGQAVGSIAGSESVPAWLYLELRHNGRPVNPLPWLAAREDKVRG